VGAFLTHDEFPWTGLQANGAASGSFNIHAPNSFQGAGSEAGSFPSAPMSDSGYASVPRGMASHSGNSNGSGPMAQRTLEKQHKAFSNPNAGFAKAKKAPRSRATSNPGTSNPGLMCPYKDGAFEGCDEGFQCQSALKYVHAI
jgi:hypothetical protein